VQLQSVPELPPEDEVVRLSRSGRASRLAATALVLALLLAGTVWGTDDSFPFGPFRMYSTRADPNAPVISTRVVGLTGTGEEVRLSGGQVGLRRAEFEGQIARITQQPELLGLLADSYAERNPRAPDLVEVQVVHRRFELRDGTRTGDFEDIVVVEHGLDGQP
jgi:hypothetical protein